MAAVQTRGNKFGNVVKKEFWADEKWCRKVITLTYADIASREIGTVVVDDGATGTYAAIPIDSTVIIPADPVAVVVDPDFEALVLADLALGSPVDSVQVTAITRGPAVLREGALAYGDLAETLNPAIVRTTLVTNDVDLATFFSINSQA